MTQEELKSLIERLHSVWSTGDLAAIPTIYTRILSLIHGSGYRWVTIVLETRSSAEP